MKAVTFWILVAINALAAAIPLYFFVAGLADGTVTGRNIAYWLPALACPPALLGLGFRLRSLGRVWPANAVLALLAIPSLVAAIAIVLMALNPGAFR